MFKRKLSALDYRKDYNPQGKRVWTSATLLDPSPCLTDENQFRQMILWLEDMKIRLYPIDGRQSLRDVQNPQWEQALSKVSPCSNTNTNPSIHSMWVYL